jgi:hypothetical protein
VPKPEAGGNSDCAHWCAANFAHPGQCTSQAAHGEGPCYDCGPQNTVSSRKLCSGACTDTSSDPSNCGECGNVVSIIDICTFYLLLHANCSYQCDAATGGTCTAGQCTYQCGQQFGMSLSHRYPVSNTSVAVCNPSIGLNCCGGLYCGSVGSIGTVCF